MASKMEPKLTIRTSVVLPSKRIMTTTSIQHHGCPSNHRASKISSQAAKRTRHKRQEEEENVIQRGFFRERDCVQLTSMIVIFIIIISSSSVLTLESTFHDLDSSSQSSPGPISQLRAKRMAGASDDKTQQQQQTIPAANPNFEAAFQGECGKNNNNNPCEHICLDLHDGTYECSCFYGFTLAVDGYSCAHLTDSAATASSQMPPPDASQNSATTNIITTTKTTTTPPGPGMASTAASKLTLKPGVTQSTTRQPKTASNPTRLDGMLAEGLAGPFAASDASAAIKGTTDNDVGGSPAATLTIKTPQTARSPSKEPRSGSTSSSRGSQRDDFRGSAREAPPLPLLMMIGQSADDNRKLVDELAMGAKGPGMEPAQLVGGDNIATVAAGAGDGNGIGAPLPPSPQRNETPAMARAVGRRRQRRLQQGVAARIRQEGATTTKAAGTAASGDASNNPAHQGNANWRAKHRLSYDVDQTVPSTRELANDWASHKTTINGPQEFIELNLGASQGDQQEQEAEAAVDLGPEIRSIMINNDKLVALLAKTVELSSQQAGGFVNDDDDDDGNMGELLVRGAADDDGNERDYEMNLLADLVGRTIGDNFRLHDDDDNDKPKLTGQNQLIYHNGNQTNNFQYDDDAQDNQDKINEPISSNRLEQLNQSSRTKATRRKPRRSHYFSSHHHSNQSRNPTNHPFPSQSSPPTSQPFVQLDRPRSANQSYSASDDSSTSSASYRDCSEMPADCAKAGGHCSEETVRISSRGGSDLARLESRARCRCPIGRGGKLCQKAIQRSIPKFMGQSYLSLPMVTDFSLTNLSLVFRPEAQRLEGATNVQISSGSSLLLQSQDFLLVLDDMQRVELRYSTQITEMAAGNDNNDSLYGGKITRVLGSQDAKLDRWNELWITDGITNLNDQLKSPPTTGNDDERIVLIIPERIHLAHKSIGNKLFVAGNPTATRQMDEQGEIENSGGSMKLFDNDKSIGGFRGCIRELRLNDRNYNFRSYLNSYDIVECDCHQKDGQVMEGCQL